MLSRRLFLAGSFMSLLSPVHAQTNNAFGQRLVDVARQQIGVTVTYDGSYQKLKYPNGDVPRTIGVCTDVVIRAYRDAFGYDLQKAVHEDMRDYFSLYPKNWNLKQPDSNIDHRRVPNLQTFFRRKNAERSKQLNLNDLKTGDLITMLLPGNLPHITIVSDQLHEGIPMVVHNVGRGTQQENFLQLYPITGHFRFNI